MSLATLKENLARERSRTDRFVADEARIQDPAYFETAIAAQRTLNTTLQSQSTHNTRRRKDDRTNEAAAGRRR